MISVRSVRYYTAHVLLYFTTSCVAQQVDSSSYIPYTEHQYYLNVDVNNILILDIIAEHLTLEDSVLMRKHDVLLQLELDSVDQAWRIREIRFLNKDVLDTLMLTSAYERIMSAISISMDAEAKSYYALSKKPVLFYLRIPRTANPDQPR